MTCDFACLKQERKTKNIYDDNSSKKKEESN